MTEKGDALQQAGRSSSNLGYWTSLAELTETPPNGDLTTLRHQVKCHLTGRLDELLEANSMIDVEYRRTGCKLDSRLLPTIRTGNPFVFVRREEMQAVDTALYVLLDGSGSMRGQPWISTEAVAFALKDVMHKHQIPCGLMAFSEKIYSIATLDGRWKGQHQPFHLLPGDGTLTIAGLDKAAMELIHRTEARKLILVVTDGEPDGVSTTTGLVRDLENCDIQVAHLFIGESGTVYENELKEAGLGQVSRCTKINDPKSLAKAAEESLVTAFKRYMKTNHH